MTLTSSSDIAHSAIESCKELLEQLIAHQGPPELEAERTAIEQLAAKLYKQSRKHRRIEAARQRQLQDLQISQYENDENLQPINSSTATCYMCQASCPKPDPRQVPLCRECHDLNQSKNRQFVDLHGRRAIVTGGRTKIGYATALRLLRWGANVCITTRFPWDAAQRFSSEPDWNNWCDRLSIYQADFRDLPQVLSLIAEWNQCLGGLDILVNNAAISVKESRAELIRLENREQKLKNSPNIGYYSTVLSSTSQALSVRRPEPTELSIRTNTQLANLSQAQHNRTHWNQRLAETDPVELVEMFLVNAHVPCMLASHLLPLLKASKFADRYIVNVTGTDGIFSTRKGQRHPQLNMSKAALNMMTRTSADEYAEYGVFMNSVDTGWITNWAEGDVGQSETMPPLTADDGSSRILDPIAQTIQSSSPVFGHLWRNFQISEW